ncbi:AAA family ATPase [Amycolatopsis ultiminotia]|uniref:AAA family ATPase n=1 Tax=Amycolatopsis ultiminotia TaxID=543629 RepID=UPI0031ECADA5
MAADRLSWFLDGLNANVGWGADAAEVLAPEFAALIPPDRFVAWVQRQAAACTPVVVTGIDLAESTARARIRTRDGSVRVANCVVEAEPPHRITLATTTELVPSFTAPPLPADFTGSPLLDGQGEGSRLIVFSGPPGTGKSTLADATGHALRAPVFAVDWLLGALTSFGGYHFDDRLGIGTELAITLALRQFRLGQSAVVDHPAEEPAARARWESLARAAGASFKVVVCTCSDRRLHRERLEGRVRAIPGWHERGNWADVERRLAQFPPWTGEVLTVDAVRPMAENLAAVLDYVTG